jgi:hypothetical protein
MGAAGPGRARLQQQAKHGQQERLVRAIWLHLRTRTDSFRGSAARLEPCACAACMPCQSAGSAPATPGRLPAWLWSPPDRVWATDLPQHDREDLVVADVMRDARARRRVAGHQRRQRRQHAAAQRGGAVAAAPGPGVGLRVRVCRRDVQQVDQLHKGVGMPARARAAGAQAGGSGCWVLHPTAGMRGRSPVAAGHGEWHERGHDVWSTACPEALACAAHKRLGFLRKSSVRRSERSAHYGHCSRSALRRHA